MKKVKYLFVIASVVLCGFFYNKEALSWDNKKTHRDLSKIAAEQSVLSKSKSNYLKNLGFKDELLESFKWNGNEKYVIDWLQEGADLEDKGSPLFPVLGTSRSVNHFHNPLKPWNIAGLDDTVLKFRYTGESSLLWSQDQGNQLSYPEGDWSWQALRNCYYVALTAPSDSERQASFAATFRGLGHQIHLIQDGAQPDHVRNNAHPWDTTGLKGWIGIEKWANDNPSFINSLASNPMLAQVSFDVSYNELAPISQLFDAEQYSGSSPTTSLNQGITEYTNANFFSDDTIFAAERYSTSHRHYFPYPKRGSTDLQSYINGTKPPETIASEDGLEDKVFWISKVNDGETIDHFLKVGLLTPTIYKLFGEGELFYSSFHRDEECHKDYARKLIPRAVGYSAGLLNYFFRGQLNMQATDKKPNGDIEISITSLSDDSLVVGDFEVYYDHKDGTRKKVDNLTPSHVENLSKYDDKKPETIFKATFSPPNATDFDSTKKDWYMLVYNGQLGGTKNAGGEKGAVIGKYQRIQIGIPVMATYDQHEMKAFFKVAKREEDEKKSDFFIDLEPVLRELGHAVISPVSLKIVEYSGKLGAVVYTINETTYCVLMFEVLGLSSPPEEIGGYQKRDFMWVCEQFDMSNAVLDPIPPTPECSWGIPGRPLGTAYHYFQATRGGWEYKLATGVESTFRGYEIYGPAGYEDLHWIERYYADHLERTGVNQGTPLASPGAGPKTVAVPIGISVWVGNTNGHLADIEWGIHFSCLAGYAFYIREEWSIKNEFDAYEESGGGVWLQTRFNVPFMLIKERGRDLRLEDPMHVFDSPWAVDDGVAGPISGVAYDPPDEIQPPPVNYPWDSPARLGYNAYKSADGRWPGSYKHVYPILDSNGILSQYALHSTRLRYPSRYMLGEEHFIDSLPITVVNTQNRYCTGIRPPGFYFGYDRNSRLIDSTEFRSNTVPNGRFVFHAGGGTTDRVMLRISPKSRLLPDYDAASGKDRSVYVINGGVYDYTQPVPLLFGDSKVSRELFAARSIYGMDKPPILDSTIDVDGNAVLTGRMEGYLDLEGDDGNGYFSDFGILKQLGME